MKQNNKVNLLIINNLNKNYMNKYRWLNLKNII